MKRSISNKFPFLFIFRTIIPSQRRSFTPLFSPRGFVLWERYSFCPSISCVCFCPEPKAQKSVPHSKKESKDTATKDSLLVSYFKRMDLTSSSKLGKIDSLVKCLSKANYFKTYNTVVSNREIHGKYYLCLS